jgi:hypothetical protein
MNNYDERIIAVDLRGGSFAFAVFEGPDRLLDWGVRSFRRGVNAVKVPAGKKFAAILDYFLPDAVVVRVRTGDRDARRGKMREILLRESAKRGTPTRLLSRRAVKEAFAGANRTKYTIAAALAERLPELAPVLPTAHKLWVSEDYILSVFDAAAVGITYFSRHESSTAPTPQI